jgi:hypothetical protein
MHAEGSGADNRAMVNYCECASGNSLLEHGTGMAGRCHRATDLSRSSRTCGRRHAGVGGQTAENEGRSALIATFGAALLLSEHGAVSCAVPCVGVCSAI